MLQDILCGTSKTPPNGTPNGLSTGTCAATLNAWSCFLTEKRKSTDQPLFLVTSSALPLVVGTLWALRTRNLQGVNSFGGRPRWCSLSRAGPQHLSRGAVHSGEDDLSARSFGVEVAHGDDFLYLLDEVVLLQAEQVD